MTRYPEIRTYIALSFSGGGSGRLEKLCKNMEAERLFMCTSTATSDRIAATCALAVNPN